MPAVAEHVGAVDAAAAVAEAVAPVDASSAPPPADAAQPHVDAPPKKQPPQPPPPHQQQQDAPPPPPTQGKFNKADLQKAYEGGQYIGVITQCSAGAAAIDPALCTLAACRVSNAGKAKQFYAATPAKRRAQVIQTCASLGIALAGTTIQRTDP